MPASTSVPDAPPPTGAGGFGVGFSGVALAVAVFTAGTAADFVVLAVWCGLTVAVGESADGVVLAAAVVAAAVLAAALAAPTVDAALDVALDGTKLACCEWWLLER